MSSGSFTILPYINPPAGYVDVSSAVANIASADNNFTVPQRMAGIVNSANLTVAGTSRFTGVCTFDAIPQFDAGIEVDISTLSTGSLVVSGSSALNGGLSVVGAVSLPSASLPASTLTKSITDAQIVAAGVGQASVLNGYVDLVGAQSVAGVKTFASPPVMSGASISAASIPAASIVSDSISDTQISPAGIGQSSIASGYVDLASIQSVAGAKTFTAALAVTGAAASFNGGMSATTISSSGVASLNSLSVAGTASVQSNLSVNGFATINGPGGLSVANGVSALQAVTCTTLSSSGGITGNLTGNVTGISSRVQITSDNTNGSYMIPFTKTAGSNTLFCDDTTTPLITYNPSSGLLTAASFTATSTATLSGGVVLPVAQASLTIATNSVAVNMNNLSLAEFILPSAALTANITTMTFANMPVNGKFNIYIQGGAANRVISKNLSSGAITQVNNLGGNTQIAANSVWRIEGFVLTSTLVALNFTNYT